MKAIILGAAALITVVASTSASAEPPENVLYIPLGGENQLLVVDIAEDTVLHTIKGLPAVHGLAGTPDGRFLVAGSYQERAPTKDMQAKPATVSPEDHAAHHAAPEGGAMQQPDGALSTVSIVRTSDGEIVRRIEVQGAVHHMAVSPDGRLAVATHPASGRISVIDLASYEVVANIATGPLPNYAVFSPDSDQIYVSNAGNDTVSAVDARRWIVQWNAVVGANPEHVVLSSDGATLYLNNVGDGTVTVLDLNDRKVIKSIPVGRTLHGIDLSEDGRTLFVASLGDNKVVAIDLATGTYRSIPLAPAPYHLATVRGGGKLYVSSSELPKLWVLNEDDLSLMSEIPIGGKGHQMVQGGGT